MPKQRLIKICGVKEPLLAALVVKAGATHIGIMTYHASKRYVDLATAQAIAKAVKKAGGIPVAVFVDYNKDRMLTFCQMCDIQVIQLHGLAAKANHPLLPETFQRIYVLDGNHFDEDVKYLQPERDLLLFDAALGGQGVAFDHDKFVYHGPFSYFIAGGLNVENVSKAIQLTQAHGVDTSSGVENEAGYKSLGLIKSFIQEVQSC